MSKPKLNLYFVLGGAVSAGAYTAGVLDFIVKTVDNYTADPNSKYDISIKGMAGASAGGVCGSIIGRAFTKSKQWAQSPGNSDLHNIWVNKIDFKHLAATTDLEKGNAYSLLNGNIIKEIAQDVVSGAPTRDSFELPKFVSEDFQLLLSVTNSRGLNYELQFKNKDPRNSYWNTNHRDYFHFSFSSEDQSSKGIFDFNSKANWKTLEKASVATAAFPIGLPPVHISRNIDYLLHMQKTQFKDGYPGGKKPTNIGSGTFEYYGIDGGTVDNEPLGSVQKMIETAGDEDYRIIFIDPFPCITTDDGALSLTDQIGRLYTVFRNQGTFKPQEMSDTAENNEKVFLIAPKRTNTSANELQLAGAAVAAFSGFVDKSFREFDYNLGLRNTQRFLSHHFTFNGQVVFKDVGNEIRPKNWPSISSKQYDVNLKPFDKRVKKLTNILVGSWKIRLLIKLFAKKVPRKELKKILQKHKLVHND